MHETNAPVFISIVIPVYNEEQRIEVFLSKVISYVRKLKFIYEILIVDDGSVDATVKITDSVLKEALPGRYRIIKLVKNQGKGGAVRKGMLEARGDYVFFIDADGSTAIEEIDRFIPLFSPGFDIYIAIRTVKHEAPLKRKFFGYGYIHLANFLLNLKVSDFTCGFKCYRREAAQKVFSKQIINNWSFDAEDLYIAKKCGCKIKETPVYWAHCGGSKVKVLKNVIICGFDLLKIRYNDMCGRYDGVKRK